MTIVLAEMFTEASAEDARLLAYLSQGTWDQLTNRPILELLTKA